MFGSLGWWPIMATSITILSIVFSTEINSELGIDWIGLLGGELWQQACSALLLWISTILIFWLSGMSFANGWDTISDFAKWRRRSKTNQKVRADLVKLRELLN